MAVISDLILVLFISAALLLSPSCTYAAGEDHARAPLAAGLRNSIREVRIMNGRKLVAFTFDLCEGPRERAGFDEKLVDFLEVNRVRATFFAGGKWMRSHPQETLRLMRTPLFEIGNHSWSHANFRKIDSEEARAQIELVEQEYRKIRSTMTETDSIPDSPGLFRFPYGACRKESLALLAEFGIPAIQWSIVSGDPAPNQTAHNIIHTVLLQVRSGSIVIFHANGRGHGTLEALRALVPGLRNQGYEFATVSELLASGVPVSSPECYELRPGDTARYDRKPR